MTPPHPAPVCVLIHPNGTATWYDNISHAQKHYDQHGIGRAFLDERATLRIAMSDCALILTEHYPPNPYAQDVLTRVAGGPPRQGATCRGPVCLFAYDPNNEWDSTRPFTPTERTVISNALDTAGCTYEERL